MAFNNGTAGSMAIKGMGSVETNGSIVPKPDPDAPQAKREPWPGPAPGPPTSWPPKRTPSPDRKRAFGNMPDGHQQGQPAKKLAAVANNQGQGGNNKNQRRRGRNKQPAGPVAFPVQAPAQAPAMQQNPFGVAPSQQGNPFAQQPLVQASPFAQAYAPALTPLQQQQQQQQFQQQQFQQQQFQQPQYEQQMRMQHQQQPQYFFKVNQLHIMMADARGTGPNGNGGMVQMGGGPLHGLGREVKDVTMLEEDGSTGQNIGWGGNRK